MAVAASILTGLAAASAPVFAKTKTQCAQEWQANKVARNVADCRATVADTAKPAAAPAKPEKDYPGVEFGGKM